MTDVNMVVIIGRLTRDLGNDQREFCYLQNGTARANVSVAVNRSRKQGDQWIDEASYFDVTIWGKTAENLRPYLTKGKQIAVKGFLRQERWEKDGQKHSRISIVAEDVQLLGGNQQNQNQVPQAYQQPVQYQQPAMQSAPQQPMQPQSFGQQQAFTGKFQEDLPYNDSDIPF